MKIETVISGKLNNNTYLVITGQNNAVIVDPSVGYDKISDALSKSGAHLEYIMLTHGHYDHTASALLLREQTGAKIVINSRDAEMLYDSKKSLSFLFTNHPDLYNCDIKVDEGDKIVLDELEFTFLNTPGHTKGSMVILCEDYMFSGDTVLKLSVGRTDFYGGSDSFMKQSVKKLSCLDKNYVLLCGHGDKTTLNFEKENNMYFKEYV